MNRDRRSITSSSCNTRSASAPTARTATEEIYHALAGKAQAAFNVFACEPEWAALASELGGSDISVFAATSARQDPHQIQARPALIARLRNADLVVCTGAELEIGWMPVLLRQASNGRVQPGTPGYLAAADQVRLLEIPTRLDRADGDVHAAGNPHIQGDPRNVRAVAVALGQRLGQLDGAHAAAYAQRTQDFLKRWDEATKRWEAKAAPLKGTAAVVYHKDWTYLLNWLGMTEAATIEPKPGVPPGSAYLAQLLDDIPRKSVRMILFAAYQEPRAASFVADKTGLPAVMLPFTVGGTEAAGSLSGFYEDTVQRLLDGLEKSRARGQ
jgi:zinc/manganese transport system substrate-binding protein